MPMNRIRRSSNTRSNSLTKAKVILVASGLALAPLSVTHAATTTKRPKSLGHGYGPAVTKKSPALHPHHAYPKAAIPNDVGLGYAPAKPQKSVDSLGDLFLKGTVSAHARLYEFAKFHQNYTGPSSAPGGAIGGDFLYQSAKFKGLSGGVAINTQHRISFLTPSANPYPDYVANRLTSITQAYLQYQGYGIRARAGRQLMSTPFAAPAMYTMMPRSYYGVTVTANPLEWTNVRDPKQISLFFGRITRYESRFGDTFSAGNKYFRNRNLKGFYAVGLNYRSPHVYAGQDLKARAWYYHFYDIANLYYVDGQSVATNIGSSWHPLVGFQAADEHDTGSSLLGKVDAQFYGIKLGVKYPNGSVSLVGTYTPTHSGAYAEGGLAIPYGRMQNNGGVFTATMNNGNMDIGAGYGYGIKIRQSFLGHDLNVYLNYIRLNAKYGFGGNDRYDTGYTSTGLYGFPAGGTPFVDQRQQSVGVGFSFNMGYVDASLKELTVQDQFNMQSAQGEPHDYLENRFRLIYTFN